MTDNHTDELRGVKLEDIIETDIFTFTVDAALEDVLPSLAKSSLKAGFAIDSATQAPLGYVDYAKIAEYYLEKKAFPKSVAEVLTPFDKIYDTTSYYDILVNPAAVGEGTRFHAVVQGGRLCGVLDAMTLRSKLVRFLFDARSIAKVLENKLKIRDDFLGIVVHDMRSPLSIISVCCDYLASILHKKPGSEELLDFVQRIYRNNDRALQFVSDLLDIGKLESGVKLQFEDINLANYFAEIAANLHFLADAKKIKIHFKNDLRIRVPLDHRRFTQIIDNLVGNAIKYSPEGSTITITSQYLKEGGRGFARVLVTDQGIGIPKDKREKIFEKYIQLTPAGPIESAGVGLGLAIAAQFAKLHNASLSIEAVEEGGTTFALKIPDAHLEPAHEAMQIKKSILVVEDDEDICELVENIAKDLAFQVYTASDGQQGLELYRKFRPGLVISDIRMPHMDGIELLQHIKMADATVPIILISGYYQNINSDLARSIFKADSMVAKPFEAADIKRAILERVGMSAT